MTRRRTRRGDVPARRCARGSTPGLDAARGARRARPPALPRGARASGCARPLRRLEGDYREDEWGFDEEFAELVEPLLRVPLRPLVAGARRPASRTCPAHGRALLAANHAGILPWDATMMSVAILREHPLPRYPALPRAQLGLRPAVRVGGDPQGRRRRRPRPTTRCGCSSRTSWWRSSPRGSRAPASPSRERYRLQRFGRGGFVEIALRTGAPIVPVAVVGSEEIYPKLGESRAAGAAHRRALLPAHADVPVARPARRGAAAVEVADRVLRADRHRAATAPTPPTTARWCSSCPSRCARRSSSKRLREPRASAGPRSSRRGWSAVHRA